MNINKKQFKKYIKHFNKSFNSVIKNNFYTLNKINDISNIDHSLFDLNNFKLNKNIKLFYSNNFNLISTNKKENLKYFIYVEIGKLQDNCSIGSIYFIYDFIEKQIIQNIRNDISFFNYCINDKALNKMLKFI